MPRVASSRPLARSSLKGSRARPSSKAVFASRHRRSPTSAYPRRANAFTYAEGAERSRVRANCFSASSCDTQVGTQCVGC
eukprot:4313837-Pyramimonas_sp.AAC.1